MLNNSVSREWQKHSGNDDKSQMAAGSKFHAVGPDIEKLRNSYRG